MDRIILYTDGACSGNPGPGGYCSILKYGEHTRIISGAEASTTNNRMELKAVIEGLKALRRPCDVTVISDSKYVCDAINEQWLDNWIRKNWKKSDGKAVLNQEMWNELNGLLSVHKVTFQWIKGHAGHPFNEKCDEIAVGEYKKLIESI